MAAAPPPCVRFSTYVEPVRGNNLEESNYVQPTEVTAQKVEVKTDENEPMEDGEGGASLRTRS